MSANEQPCSSTHKRSISDVASGSLSILPSKNEFCEMLTEYFRPYVNDAYEKINMNYIPTSLSQFSFCLQREELFQIYLEFLHTITGKLYEAKYPPMGQFCLCQIFSRLKCPESLPKKRFSYNFPTMLLFFVCSNDSLRYLLLDLFKYSESWKIHVRHCLRIEESKAEAWNFIFDLAKILIKFGHLPSNYNKGTLVDILDQNYPTIGELTRLIYVSYVVIVKMESQEDLQSNMKSLDMLFQAIPQPIVTVQEISRLLHLILHDEAKESFIKAFCNKFVEEFPSRAHPLQPRSLKHLCRVGIRECLRQSKKLSHGIWGLDLPISEKNYVMLYNEEESFLGKYMSALFTAKTIPTPKKQKTSL